MGDAAAAVVRPDLDAGVARQGQPGADLRSEFFVRFEDDLGGVRTPGRDVARQGQSAAADVDDADAFGRGPGQHGEVENFSDALHVFELEPQRVGRVHPGLLGVAGHHHEGTPVVRSRHNPVADHVAEHKPQMKWNRYW